MRYEIFLYSFLLIMMTGHTIQWSRGEREIKIEYTSTGCIAAQQSRSLKNHSSTNHKGKHRLNKNGYFWALPKSPYPHPPNLDKLVLFFSDLLVVDRHKLSLIPQKLWHGFSAVGKAVFGKEIHTTLGVEPRTYSNSGRSGNHSSVCWIKKLLAIRHKIQVR